MRVQAPPRRWLIYLAAAGPGLIAAAAGNDQASDFSQAPRDKSGDAVVAEIESVTNACRNGHDILQRAPQFDSYHIVVGVHPEARVAEVALHTGGKIGVFGRDC